MRGRSSFTILHVHQTDARGRSPTHAVGIDALGINRTGANQVANSRQQLWCSCSLHSCTNRCLTMLQADVQRHAQPLTDFHRPFPMSDVHTNLPCQPRCTTHHQWLTFIITSGGMQFASSSYSLLRTACSCFGVCSRMISFAISTTYSSQSVICRLKPETRQSPGQLLTMPQISNGAVKSYRTGFPPNAYI